MSCGSHTVSGSIVDWMWTVLLTDFYAEMSQPLRSEDLLEVFPAAPLADLPGVVWFQAEQAAIGLNGARIKAGLMMLACCRFGNRGS